MPLNKVSGAFIRPHSCTFFHTDTQAGFELVPPCIPSLPSTLWRVMGSVFASDQRRRPQHMDPTSASHFAPYRQSEKFLHLSRVRGITPKEFIENVHNEAEVFLKKILLYPPQAHIFLQDRSKSLKTDGLCLLCCYENTLCLGKLVGVSEGRWEGKIDVC